MSFRSHLCVGVNHLVLLNNSVVLDSPSLNTVEDLCGGGGCECLDDVVLVRDDSTLVVLLVLATGV